MSGGSPRRLVAGRPDPRRRAPRWRGPAVARAVAQPQNRMRVCRLARIGYSSERTPLPPLLLGGPIRWRADVAQLVAHHLAKVRVAGSNPVVRSRCRKPSREPTDRTALRYQSSSPQGLVCGGMAEWLRQGPAKPCTRVRFPLPPRGRLAQRESASLTRKRSLVQSQYRPPVQIDFCSLCSSAISGR